MSKTIPQLDPVVSLSRSNKFEVSQSDASSAESKYGTLDQLATIIMGNKFVNFTGPLSAIKIFTLPNSNAIILTDAALVTVPQGGTGLASGTSGGLPYFNTTTTMASSGLLINHALMLGGGAGASPSTLGSLGTTTTVLHGNAAGAPSYGAVSLTDDISGILTGANGGTGVNNGASTITYGGNIIFSGAHTFTGTLTADTAVTFPVSGTLATDLQSAWANGTGVVTTSAGKPVAVVSTGVTPTPSNSSVFDAQSTTQGSRALPVMMVAERDAISSPVIGLGVFVSDVSPPRPYVFNGDWAALAYFSEVTGVTLQTAYNQGNGQIDTTVGKPVNFYSSGFSPSSDNSSLFDAQSTTQGVRVFPAMTTTQRNAISSPANSLQIYNITTNTIDYFDGSAWQISLTLDHLLAGDNITLMQNGDGTVTINASGSSPSGNSDYSGWSFLANTTSTTQNVIDTYYPITINPATFSDIISSNFVNEVVTISSSPTPVFRYIDDATQYFDVNINVFVKGSAASQQEYVFQIFIQKADTSIVFTSFYGTAKVQDLIFPTSVPLSGVVQLSTGDRVGVCVKNITSTTAVTVTYGNSTIVNVDAAAAATLQTAYMNGTGIIQGNLNTKPFQLKNSGGTALLTSSETAVNITGNASTVTTNANLTGPVTSVGNATSITNNAVTYAAFQQIGALSLFGNATGSLANGSEITLGATIAFNGGVLQTTGIKGDVTSSDNSFDTTLATVNSNVGSFGSSTQVGTFTVNAKGLITAAGNTTISGVAPGGSATGDLSGSYPNPTVAKINGATLGTTTATSGNVLIGSGIQWVTNAIGGDATLGSTGTLIVTKTNGVAFAASATTNTTNAGNISSGTLPSARIAGFYTGITQVGTLNSLAVSGGSTTLIPSITNTLTGSSNTAGLSLSRGDSANGFAELYYKTGSTFNWGVGTQAGDSNYYIQDVANSVNVINIVPGSGTTSIFQIAGQVQLSALSVSAPLFTDSSRKITNSGTVPVGNGGTGIASGTSGGIPYFSGISTIASSGLLAANQLMIGGGAATTPATLGSLGTTTTVLHGNAAGAPTFGAVSLTADVSGTLPNSNTTATSANTASTIVSRDGSGDFSAGTITSGGLSVANTGNITASVASSTTGSSNSANLALSRGDSANGFARTFYKTGSTFNYTMGLEGGDSNFYMQDVVNSVTLMTVFPGSGTSSTFLFAGNVQPAGNIKITTAGKTLYIKEGSNACKGTGATMVGGTVTVNTTAVATGDMVVPSCTAQGGTPGLGMPAVTINNGVSFTLTSQNALDTSTFSWFIVKAA